MLIILAILTLFADFCFIKHVVNIQTCLQTLNCLKAVKTNEQTQTFTRTFYLSLSTNFINPKNGLRHLRESALQRRETLSLLREMGEYLDSMPISCVFLKNRNNAALPLRDDYELHIKATLSSLTRNLIQKVVRKHELRLKESDGFLVIYSPERELLEITA